MGVMTPTTDPVPVTPAAPSPAYAASAPEARPPLVVWDLVISIAAMLAGLGISAVLTFSGVFLVFASDSCGGDRCDLDRLTVGWLVAVVGPVITFIVTTIFTIVIIVRRRHRAFWLPLVGIALSVGLWALGAALVFSSVGQA